MAFTNVRRLALSSGLLALSAVFTTGCSDSDSDAADAAPAIVFDAGPADSAVGVVCPGAEANYPGSLDGPAAGDDGVAFVFRGILGAADVLRISAASAEAAAGEFDLEAAGPWSVEICVDDGDESCGDALPAFSGELTVTSVEGRFQASLDRAIFVDDLTTPTCSASVSQSSIDVAILGPI